MPSKRLYWDSMVFIYRLNKHTQYLPVLEHITQQAEKGEVTIVTSAFTTVEVGKLPNGGNEDEQEKAISDFFENDFIRIIPVDRRVARKSREIMRLFPGVKGKDAVHLATACVTPGVAIMHTYDNELLKKNGLLPDCSLSVEKPSGLKIDTTGVLFKGEALEVVEDVTQE